MVKEVTTVEIP